MVFISRSGDWKGRKEPLEMITNFLYSVYVRWWFVYMQGFHNSLNETFIPCQWCTKCGEVGTPLPRCRRWKPRGSEELQETMFPGYSRAIESMSPQCGDKMPKTCVSSIHSKCSALRGWIRDCKAPPTAEEIVVIDRIWYPGGLTCSSGWPHT